MNIIIIGLVYARMRTLSVFVRIRRWVVKRERLQDDDLINLSGHGTTATVRFFHDTCTTAAQPAAERLMNRMRDNR